MKAATGEEGEGTPAKLVVNHKAAEVNCEPGVVTFENGNKINADLIVGADGVSVRERHHPFFLLALRC